MFDNEPELFFIGTISLPLKTLEIVVINTLQLKRIIETIDSRAEPYCNLRGSEKTTLDNKLKVNLEDKVYHKTYYHHTLGQMHIVETLTKV